MEMISKRWKAGGTKNYFLPQRSHKLTNLFSSLSSFFQLFDWKLPKILFFSFHCFLIFHSNNKAKEKKRVKNDFFFILPFIQKKMNCEKCGKERSLTAKFCIRCGSKSALTTRISSKEAPKKPQLSKFEIGELEALKNAAKVVIDCGSYETKVGFAGDDSPNSCFPTIVGHQRNVNFSIYNTKFVL